MSLDVVYTSTDARLRLGGEEFPVESGIAITSGVETRWLPAREWRVLDEATDDWLVIEERKADGQRVMIQTSCIRCEVLTQRDDHYDLRDWARPERLAQVFR